MQVGVRVGVKNEMKLEEMMLGLVTCLNSQNTERERGQQTHSLGVC